MQTLFLVRSCMRYESPRLAFTACSFEGAVSQAELLLSADSQDDSVSVLAVAPGPGAGVVVARWECERGYPDFPCDGEGPWVPVPDVWRRTL